MIFLDTTTCGFNRAHKDILAEIKMITQKALDRHGMDKLVRYFFFHSKPM